jgi:hypothetical protein
MNPRKKILKFVEKNNSKRNFKSSVQNSESPIKHVNFKQLNTTKTQNFNPSNFANFLM